jgi:hypothetical protein
VLRSERSGTEPAAVGAEVAQALLYDAGGMTLLEELLP